MKVSLGVRQFAGFAFTSFFGTVLHFLFDLTGGSVLAAPFSGVNESIFEHMKLLFWPMAAFSALEYRRFRGREDYLSIRLRGILLGLLLIPVIFCTVNGTVGKTPDWFNITIFFISAGAAYFYETRLFGKEGKRYISGRTAFLILLLIGGLFVLFTFFTPRFRIFLDPVTGTYGI